MSYEEELAAKGQRVRDALERVGGVHLELPPVLGAESPLRYRNKVQFPVSRGKCGLSIGFYRPRSHDVVDTEDCLLQPEADTALRLAFKGWMEDFQIPAYDESTGRGLIRHLYIRTNRAGQGPVLRSGQREGACPTPESLSGCPARRCPRAWPGWCSMSIIRDTNVILGDAYRTLWGRDWLEEELCGLTFRLSVPSFFQINRDQTERLYQLALEFAGLHRGGDGAGPVLRHRHHLPVPWPGGPGMSSGRRWCPRPLRMPKQNAAARRMSHNAEFFCGDAGAVAAQSLADEGVRPQGHLRGPAPQRAWPRRCRRCWPPWRRSASSTSPATRPPWPGM